MAGTVKMPKMVRFGEVLDVAAWRILAAERHAQAGRIDAAESAYRRVLTRQPRRPAALAGLGRLLLRERRFEEAVEIWQRAAEISPQRSEPQFQLARALHRCGRLEAAAGHYLQVLALDPLHHKAFDALEQLSERLARSGGTGTAAIDAARALAQQMLAEESGSSRVRGNAQALLASLRSRSDPDAAVQDWEQLAAQDPGAIEPLLQIARVRKRQQRNDEACRAFQAVLDRQPDHAEALMGYGQALAESDPAAAIRHFARWAERRPRDIAPRLELVQRYQKARDWQRAEAVYREILELPDDRKALLRLAQILSRDPARLELALDLWRRIAERDPKAPLPLVRRAILLERARRPADAEAEYRAAIARAPREETALIGLARLLVAQERWHDAVPLFEVAHMVNPGRSDVLLGLGRCLERLDRTTDALAAYAKVLAIDPGDANALLYRGRLLRQLGRTEEAIAAWREVCARSPQNADAWYELVFMLAGAERDGEALAALDAAEAALPASPASWTRLGLAAQAGQFHDRAIGHFERAIAAEPHEAGHRARLGQHYARQGIVDGAFHHLLASRELKPDDVAVTRQLVDTVHTLDTIGIDHIGLNAAPARCGEILVPERLFRRVREIADTEIAPYEPVARRIIAVTASLAAGGAERQLVTLLRGLSDPDLALDLSLFCISLARRSNRDFFLPMLADTPVEVVTPVDDPLTAWLGRPEVARHGQLIRSFPPEMAGPIAFWLEEFRRRRPQVVHAWQDGTSLSAAVAALLAGVPRIVLSARSVRPDNPRRRLKRFMREAYQAVLGHRSIVLCNNSRAGADDYADWLGIDPASVEVIYNGIDLDRLAQSVDLERAHGLRQSLGMPRDAPLVGSAFRMSEEKRPLLWVETAAAVAQQDPRAHFVVYGDGPMRADMATRAGQLGIGDRLHLPGPQESLGSCYKAMDVLILTSRHEGLPNVLLEAQSLGVPVVAPDVGGIAETVWQGVTGWAVKEADAPALAERVLHCLRDHPWTARARLEGPGFVQRRFGMAAMLQRTLDVYGLASARGAR
jgi:glycosyltransferase involved in cell wall biosynthesis/tetratricopeptide (TPR) repeat protein